MAPRSAFVVVGFVVALAAGRAGAPPPLASFPDVVVPVSNEQRTAAADAADALADEGIAVLLP
jgi:hypothetical protein